MAKADQDVAINFESLSSALNVSPEVAQVLATDFQEDIDDLVGKAEQVVEVEALLCERINGFDEVEKDNWDVRVMKTAWDHQNLLLSDYWVRLVDTSDSENPAVYSVQFYNLQHSDSVDGFYVSVHKTPNDVGYFDEAFEDKWNLMDNRDQTTRHLIGIALLKTASKYIGLNPANKQLLFDRIPR